ncbi:TlpA disulfide reductase family protein [Bremerella sp. JC770]|uniref:TlpA family protein disulfide reductase n=1 Tax=Bremerella sp. JC770 TaxID=3232137 RepID=UPI003459CBC9
MHTSLYNSFVLGNALLLFVSIGGVLFSAVLVLLRWNTPQRRAHATRLLIFTLMIPLLFGLQYVVQFWIYLPAVGREQMKAIQAARDAKFQESTKVLPGDAAPEFTLTDLNGNPFSTRDTHGKVLLINFFATWCGPCHAELPYLKQIWQRHQSDDHFRMLMIAREESAETIEAFRQQNEVTIPMAPDPTGEIYRRFASESIPRNFVVSAEGKVVYARSGFYPEDLDEMAELIEQALADAR